MNGSKFSDVQKAFILKQGAEGMQILATVRSKWEAVHTARNEARNT